MCLAIPVRVERVIDDQTALVDVGGVQKEISIALVDDVKAGDYVILHVGYALNKLDPEEAEQTLELFAQISEQTQAAQDATDEVH
jgi:hydrogenase expression/formation protein HypC